MNDRSFQDLGPMFIVGSARSGTTLLQLMLNAHPDIAICGEIHYFDQILEIKKRVPSIQQPNDLQRFLALVRTAHNIQLLADREPLLEAVEQKLAKENRRTYERFYRHMLYEYAEAQGARRCGEKTTANVRYLEQLTQIFPNAKIIHIVRDPRAVVASKVRMPWTADDVVVNTLKWKLEMMYSDEFPKREGSYFELRYEDLVLNPEQELRSICGFIGEEYDSKMLEYFRTSRKHIKGEPWKEGTYKPVNPAAIERWRQELSEAQILIIQKIVGSWMQRFGYEPMAVSPQSKLAAPVVFGLELTRYLKYKIKERFIRRSSNSSTLYWGESRSLYRMLVKSLLGLANRT